MSLDDKLWIYSFNNGSASAKLLAQKLDVWMILHEGSTYKGKKGQFILNWGCGRSVFQPNVGSAQIINAPELVDIAVNKREFFEYMIGAGGPRLPYWTTSEREARSWLENDEVVIARTKLEGAKGAGLVVMKKPVDFVPASLYTIRVENHSEYRVYMFNDEVLDARIKQPQPGHKPKDGMLVGDNVDFLEIGISLVPEDVKLQAQKAARKLKLTLQGLDIIYDGTRAWVLETNTAPYLGIQTANKYARKLTEMVEAA